MYLLHNSLDIKAIYSLRNFVFFRKSLRLVTSLDLTQAFDTSSPFQTETIQLDGYYRALHQRYLSNRFFSVKNSGEQFAVLRIKAGVLQKSLLGLTYSIISMYISNWTYIAILWTERDARTATSQLQGQSTSIQELLRVWKLQIIRKPIFSITSFRQIKKEIVCLWYRTRKLVDECNLSHGKIKTLYVENIYMWSHNMDPG